MGADGCSDGILTLSRYDVTLPEATTKTGATTMTFYRTYLITTADRDTGRAEAAVKARAEAEAAGRKVLDTLWSIAPPPGSPAPLLPGT